MKRIGLMLTALLLVLLCSCGQSQESPTSYDVTYEGKTFTVDLIEQTISYDDVVCQFEITGDSNSVFCVTYPDGSTYWRTENWKGSESGWSDDYGVNRYVSGETLWTVLGRPSTQENESDGHLLLGLALIAIGVYQVVAPSMKRRKSRDWPEDRKPSNTMLVVSRSIGAAAIVAGLICIFI